LQGRFVVSYIGTLGMAHDLDTVLDAADMCAHLMPQVVFLLVGEGAEKERIVAQVHQRRVRNVRFLPQQQREKIPALVGASDVCLVTLKRSDVFKTVIPTKMLEFMGCARPVVLAVEGQASELMKAAGGGICIAPQDPGALLNGIQQLYSDRDLCRRLGQNGRNYISENLSRAQTAETYIGLLKDMTNAKSSGVIVGDASDIINA
jgi:colanic acid biosynthesis glycosyl transferase WcaI